jgi:hypothetical protein
MPLVYDDRLECPVQNVPGDQEQQAAATAASLAALVKQLGSTDDDPLVIEANEAFTIEHLTRIMIKINSEKLPIQFAINDKNTEDIKNLIKTFNQAAKFKDLGKSPPPSSAHPKGRSAKHVHWVPHAPPNTTYHMGGQNGVNHVKQYANNLPSVDVISPTSDYTTSGYSYDTVKRAAGSGAENTEISINIETPRYS